METLPADILQLTYGYLDDVDLAKACFLNPTLTKKICNNTFTTWYPAAFFPHSLHSNHRVVDVKGNNPGLQWYTRIDKGRQRHELKDFL